VNWNISIKKYIARHWWHTPVILEMKVAEIRRIVIQSQIPGNSSGDSISKNPTEKRSGGVVQVVRVPT
jgi:hypothetical protein